MYAKRTGSQAAHMMRYAVEAGLLFSFHPSRAQKRAATELHARTPTPAEIDVQEM